MERNRDFRRTTVSAVNSLPRRRQRMTTLRDSTDQERQMELQETVRLAGDEREFQKRRRVDRSAVQQRSDGGGSNRENSMDSSDEEYYEEEEEMRNHRTNQLSPPSSSLSMNRRGLRTLRSSPVLRAAVDEMFGGPVPRRARSSSAKRLHDYCNSGSGGFGEDLNRRRFLPSPVIVSSSGDLMKKKMRSVERRTSPISNPPKRSVVQDDIEIEVAEALFDLMKQSQSQSSQRQTDRDGVIPASDELKMSKSDGGKDENNAFSVQNEPSIKVNAETVLVDSMKELKKEGTVEKDKFSDDSALDLLSGDRFVNKVKVGSPKESDSPSCVKVIACDIQDPTVTKANNDAVIIEAKKETKLEIDLMASPLSSSAEREGLIDMRTDPGVMSQAFRKRSEFISKDGPLAVASGEKTGLINSNQQSNLDVEKHSHDSIHQQGRKEHKNQSPTSLLTFPYGMGGWPGVVPHPGFMPPLHAVMPTNGSAKSSTIMQPPPFKFSQSHLKRCATHQHLALSMLCHQQLIKKSLASGSTGSAALSLANPPNLKFMSPAQKFVLGNPWLGDFQGGQNLANASAGSEKDKSSEEAAVAFNAKTSSMTSLQQVSHPASASSFLHGSGFVLPFDHHQATVMAPANSSGSPQSVSLLSNSVARLPVNLPLPNASTAMSLNLPMFPSNEAASYMAMLQNNGCSVPISTNIAMSSFKEGHPSMAFFNPSLYPSPAFNINPQQLTTSHSSVQSATQNTHKQPQYVQQNGAKGSENKFPVSATANPQPEKPVQSSLFSSKSNAEINLKNGASLASGFGSHSVKPGNSQTSLSAQPVNFAMIPSVAVGGGGAGNKQPQAFALSFGSNASATPVLNFSSMAQTSGMFQMLPDMSRNGNQTIHQKNFQASEGKSLPTGGQSFNYSKSDGSEISGLSTMGPPKFDGLARNINFLPSSGTGSQPFQTSPAALSSGFQQHQLIQVQDFQMQLAGTGAVKSSTSRNIPGSFYTGMLPMSSPIYAQVSALNDTSSFHPKWGNFPRSAAPEGSPQLKTSQGQTHKNFGQFAIKSESMPSLMIGSSSSSSLSRNPGNSQRNASAVGLAASTTSALTSSPETEGGANQKSSPACRRNVPSILSTCPSQLPELKY